MTEGPTPPIIVNEHGDVTLHSNLESAAADLEAIDVENGEYEFFDSVGRVIHGSVSEGKIILTGGGADPPQPERLLAILRRYVQEVGPQRVRLEAPLDSTALPALVDALWRFFQPRH
jgi:hypothetical protein